MSTREPLDVSDLRRKTKLTQAKFARAIGVPVVTLQSWERKRREPSASAASLLRLAEALVTGMHSGQKQS